LTEDENSLFCKFDDQDIFEEFYNLNNDPEQLRNLASDLTQDIRAKYLVNINHLKQCHGKGCRGEPGESKTLWSSLLQMISNIFP